MLPKAHRLRRSTDFAVAMRGGRKAGRGSLVVHIGVTKPACAENTPARAGFIVSKAVGGAVTRNLVKRRLRHLVAEHLDGLPEGTHLVVRALPPSATSSYAALRQDFTSALDAALAAALRPTVRSGQ